MRKLFIAAALLAALVSCSSEDITSNSNTVKGITIKAGIPEETATRVSFASQGEDSQGLKVAWENSDILQGVISGTTNAGSFNVSSIGSDTHNASFTGNFTSTPSNGDMVNACVKTENATISGADATFNLATQSGKVGDLGKYDIVTGSGQYNSNSPINMTMKHQLSFLKAYITLPAAVTATTATVVLKGTGLVNSIKWSGSTNAFSDAQAGNLTLTGTVSGDQVIVYAAVYPGTLTNLTADVTIDATTYSNLAVAESATLEAGKLYTVSRNVSTIEDVNLWLNDDAWSKVIAIKNYKITNLTRTPNEGSDWLNATSDGTNVTLSATANTTGAPRQATLTFTNGVSTTTVNITQIENKDFAGIWDMTSYYVYTSTGSAEMSTTDTSWSATGTKPSDGLTDMLIKDGVDYNNHQELNIQEATGNTTTHATNLSVAGLYENLKAEAWGNIDLTNKAATIGILIDTRSTTKAQRLYTGPYAGQYAALMPELRTKGVTTDGTGWIWKFATIGGANLFWYTGKVAVKGHTTAITWYADKSNDRQNLTTSTGYDVWGLEVERYISTSMNVNTMIRNASGTTAAGAYAVTYQGDMIMKRTAEGYKEITIGGNN
ncbi:MAG: hypothetical protein LKG25_01950 [Prevotella sp.]|jgi:hypothetical protein|nr:hypothetical protein [Prevotella sp.]MCI1281342.1 hypothetical protein [Prevotella sp.]